MSLQPTTYRDRPGPARLPGLVTLFYFAAAFFVLTAVTDWAYIQTTVIMWKDFSSWLLFFGLVAGGIGVLLWLISLAVYRERPRWGLVAVNVLVLLAAFVNSFVHAIDGWTAIVPWGIGLSVATCVLLLISGVLARRARLGRAYS